MRNPPKTLTIRSRAKLISIFLACAAFGFTVPQIAWPQTGRATSQAKESTEGNRLLNAGVDAVEQGKMSEASRMFEQARVIFTRELGENHPNTLASMNNLAVTYSDLGQYDKALALQELTLKLTRAKLGEDHPDALLSMNNLSNTFRALGKYDKALALQEQTLKLTRAKLGNDHPDTLRSMGNLAIIYRDLGQFDKALALTEQTLKLARAKLGNDHRYTLAAMTNLASTYRDLGQYDKALALTEQTLKLTRAKLGNDHPYPLGLMNNLANTFHALGKYDKALALLEQTLELTRAKLGEDHPDTLTLMSNLAATYSALGQHDKALVLQEYNLKLRRAKLGANHPNTLSSMKNLANTYHDLGQHDNALALIPAIVAGAETLRAFPGLATEQRQSLFAKYSDDYQAYAQWYVIAKHADKAFDLGDISKARTLTDNIKGQIAMRSLPPAEQQKLQAGEIRAQALQTQIDKLSAQDTRDSGALLALQKQMDAHTTDHLKLVADLSRRYPKYAQLTQLKPTTAHQANQLLGSGEVFVSYLLSTDGMMAQVFVLDASGEAKWMDLGKIKNHAKTVAAYRELISPSNSQSRQGQLVALKEGGYQWLSGGQTVPQGATPVGKRDATRETAKIDASATGVGNVSEALKVLNRYWHDILIKPILPLAGPYKHWIISPDKDLALLPFDTLPETFDSTGAITQILAQTRNLTLVQSFAVFALLKQREAEYATLKRTKELFAMGNAVYRGGWAENRGINRGGVERGYSAPPSVPADRGNAAPMSVNVEQYAISQLVWQNLPGTAREIRAVSEVFDGAAKGSGTDIYLGPEASEGKLQQLNQTGTLKEYRYLLFSVHGYLAQNPALSSLVLSQQGNPPDIDGYVTASEWPLYDVKSDLTVLSACDTGVGRTQAGESVMGLPYALFVAGNKNTLLSLWPVDDNATAEFMRRFFTHLKAGVSQPDALSRTKQEFMRDPKWKHPKFWAAFVLYGV